MKFCLLFSLSPCARYCLLIGSQLTTWSQGNLHYIRLHFFQLNREFFCLLPSLARLYSAAASDGSLAISSQNELFLSFTGSGFESLRGTSAQTSLEFPLVFYKVISGADLGGRVQGVRTPPPK